MGLYNQRRVTLTAPAKLVWERIVKLDIRGNPCEWGTIEEPVYCREVADRRMVQLERAAQVRPNEYRNPRLVVGEYRFTQMV